MATKELGHNSFCDFLAFSIHKLAWEINRPRRETEALPPATSRRCIAESDRD